MDTSKFSSEIEKTGYVLEFKVSQALREHRWTVINNKYYVDDFQEAVREVDLVAYKVATTQAFDAYTTLIISCKKNASDAWVLLAKERDPQDPNIDWYPLHLWSNDKIMDFQVSTQTFRDSYVSFQTRSGCGRLSSLPDHHIFAFQEMILQTGKPNNDRNIFGALTGLMKAQAYELKALPQRKRDPSIYQFNLVSIVDTNLVRLDFKNDSIIPQEIDAETYIANYIVNKRQTLARINIVRWDRLSTFLDACDNLHKANVSYFAQLYETFFQDVVTDDRRREILMPLFLKEVFYPILRRVRHGAGSLELKREHITLGWSKQRNLLYIFVELPDELVQPLNSDSELTQKVKVALAGVYRYHGAFEFTAYDLPF